MQMRQLRAIMFADIVGYTAMMQNNEEHAMRNREKFSKMLNREVVVFQGSIVQSSGDGALCSFSSAIAAVNCAIAIQQEMRENPEVPLRIGIHSGDVMVDENNIYGDGVNIASRIESFAVAGGIFISAKVYDEIKNQNTIEAIPLGAFELKNVKQPIEIYAISNAGLRVPAKEQLEGKGRMFINPRIHASKKNRRTVIISALTALAILFSGYFIYMIFFQVNSSVTDKSIAVLPFENLSDNKEDEYFTEGMTDEMLTELSQISGLKVLSRTSTAQYKDTKKTMKEIGEELGVQTLVEGSVRKVGDQLRVIVQLINAKTDEHIWAETYNRKMEDVFAIQSEIAQQIAKELGSRLSATERMRIEERPTENLEAYDFYLRGKSFANDFWAGEDIQNVPVAERMFRAAFRLDPNFVEPYSYLIAMYIDVYYYRAGPEKDAYLRIVNGMLDTLLALKIDKPIVHVALGSYHYKIDRDYDLALAEFAKAIAQDPNSIEAPLLRSEIYRRQGKFDEALADLEKVKERSPNEEWNLAALFETHLAMRNAEEALMYNDKLISLLPDKAVNYTTRAFTIAVLLGDVSRAQKVITDAKPLFKADQFEQLDKEFELLEGNYKPYLDMLLQHPDTLVETEVGFRSAALQIAILYHAQGKQTEAKEYFSRARDMLEAEEDASPNDFRVLSPLGVAYAGLGERQKAIEYGNRARELAPLSEDIILGIVPLENMALIYTLLGDQDEAVQILDQLMQMPFSWYASNSIPLLKMSPRWISLKDNAAFRKLVGGMEN